ncbi:MAG: hypothetical protein AABZ06_04660, partial [Bdellovibrionota bacterium]
GVHNWISTLTQGISEAANDVEEEACLIKAYNRWELDFECSGGGCDLIELQLAFIRANKENGRRDSGGQEYWQRARQWALALMERNIGYRFVLSQSLDKADIMNFIDAPLILDACACLSELELERIRNFLKHGGQAWITAPFASHDNNNRSRNPEPLAELQKAFPGIRLLPHEDVTELLGGIIGEGAFSPLINMAGSNLDWKIRLRLHDGRLSIHLLNTALEGVAHKVAMDRWGREKVLHKITSRGSAEPLVFDLDLEKLGCCDYRPFLLSPELSSSREVKIQTIAKNRVRFSVELSGIRLYAIMK